MSQAWSYTLMGEDHVPPGIGGTLNINKAILISAVGPATAVAAGAVLDVSSDLVHIAFGLEAGIMAHADSQFLHRLLIASGNSGADLKVKTTRVNQATPADISAAADLSGDEQRFILFGWD